MTRTESMWYAVPVFLLWMIKDKLNFIENMCVDAVCHDWRNASVGYPKRKTVGDGVPWIMQPVTDFSSSVREFISIHRKMKFTVDMPEFCRSKVLFSKHGWILFWQEKYTIQSHGVSEKTTVTWANQTRHYSFFLINPLTKVKIELPDLKLDNDMCHGSFSVTDESGEPNCVAIFQADCPEMIVKIVKPDGEVWTEISYHPRMAFSVRDLKVIRDNVYCCCALGRMLIYNMASQTWKEVPSSFGNSCRTNYFVEHNEHILKYRLPGNTVSSVYMWRDNAWRKLMENYLDNINIYVHYKYCFSATVRRGLGMEVYAITLEGSSRACLYDLSMGQLTRHDINLPYRLSGLSTWVDLG